MADGSSYYWKHRLSEEPRNLSLPDEGLCDPEARKIRYEYVEVEDVVTWPNMGATYRWFKVSRGSVILADPQDHQAAFEDQVSSPFMGVVTDIYHNIPDDHTHLLTLKVKSEDGEQPPAAVPKLEGSHDVLVDILWLLHTFDVPSDDAHLLEGAMPAGEWPVGLKSNYHTMPPNHPTAMREVLLTNSIGTLNATQVIDLAVLHVLGPDVTPDILKYQRATAKGLRNMWIPGFVCRKFVDVMVEPKELFFIGSSEWDKCEVANNLGLVPLMELLREYGATFREQFVKSHVEAAEKHFSALLRKKSKASAAKKAAGRGKRSGKLAKDSSTAEGVEGSSGRQGQALKAAPVQNAERLAGTDDVAQPGIDGVRQGGTDNSRQGVEEGSVESLGEGWSGAEFTNGGKSSKQGNKRKRSRRQVVTEDDDDDDDDDDEQDTLPLHVIAVKELQRKSDASKSSK